MRLPLFQYAQKNLGLSVESTTFSFLNKPFRINLYVKPFLSLCGSCAILAENTLGWCYLRVCIIFFSYSPKSAQYWYWKTPGPKITQCLYICLFSLTPSHSAAAFQQKKKKNPHPWAGRGNFGSIMLCKAEQAKWTSPEQADPFIWLYVWASFKIEQHCQPNWLFESACCLLSSVYKDGKKHTGTSAHLCLCLSCSSPPVEDTSNAGVSEWRTGDWQCLLESV